MATNKNHKLYKTDQGSVLGGVCQGFAEVYNFDVSILRIVLVLLCIFGVGSPLIVYIVFWIVLPDKKEVIEAAEKEEYKLEDDDYIY